MNKIKVSMYFPADKIKKPIVNHLIKDFDLQVNILHADISLNKVGTLVVDITGSEWSIEEGLKFIQEQGLSYKLFNKSLIWQKEECVHCGACTAVCPSDALKMDTQNWELTFEKEKCMVCELCVRACPLKVMCVTT